MARIYNRLWLSGELEESESFTVADQSRHYQINIKFSFQVVLQLLQSFRHGANLAFRPAQVVLSETMFQDLLLLPRISDIESPHQQQSLKILLRHNLNVSDDDADGISIDVIQNMLEFISSSPPDHKIFNFGFKVKLLYISRTYQAGNRLLERIMEESAAADAGPKMVPATEESIKNLKRKRVQEDSDEECLKRKRVQDQDCVICLEELKEAVSVSMPCSHSFHGDCIEKWLRTSHYCPVCRFEMPTS